MSIYTLYAIRCIINNDTFIGITKNITDKYNPLPFFVKLNNKDNSKYFKIANSVKEHKLYNHKMHIIKKNITLQDAENCKNKILSNLKYKSLNDEFDNIEMDFTDLNDILNTQ